MQQLDAFRQHINRPQRIVLVPHRRPDADALGSALAFSAYLQKLGHTTTVISPDEYPAFLHWMPGHEQVLVYENTQDKTVADQRIAEAETICCLDFSSLDRLESLESPIAKSNAYKVLIDHHIGKVDFAQFEYWDTKAAATAELVYDLILELGDQELIDPDMASCIYAGILTDTGSFKYPSTSSKIHRIVADLIDLGAKSDVIQRLIYDNNTEARIKLLGYVLDKKLVILRDYKTAYLSLTAEELKKFDSKTGDTEGFVNYALSIEGIRFAAMFIDRSDMVSISFRSVGDFAVNEFAQSHFSGGGHKNAAGGRSTESLEKTVGYFASLLPFYKKQLVG